LPRQACVKRAAIFSAVVMQKHVVPMLEGVVDEVRGRGRGRGKGKGRGRVPMLEGVVTRHRGTWRSARAAVSPPQPRAP
jgi:hypothetical protein